MKISVIIPIFNIEKYLPKCIESVVRQSYKDLEIILVDDGSPDHCGEICDEWAKKDNRVKIFHKENGGLSDARNFGLKEATGDYILFLDGDDYWSDKYAISRLVKRIEVTNADILNFSYVKFFEKTNEFVPYFQRQTDMPLSLKDYNSQLQFMMSHGLYIASAWNKLIRHSILSDKTLFRQGVFSEDIEWCLKLLVQARSIDFVCENFYCYRQRDNSITHSIDDKKCTDLCDNIIRCFKLCNTMQEDKRKAIYAYIAFQYSTFIKIQAQAKNKQIKNIKRLSVYKWVLKYHNGNKKVLVLYVMCKMIGYERTCGLVRSIYNKNRCSCV